MVLGGGATATALVGSSLSGPKKPRRTSTHWLVSIVTHLGVAVGAFHFGFMTGHSSCTVNTSNNNANTPPNNSNNNNNNADSISRMEKEVKQEKKVERHVVEDAVSNMMQGNNDRSKIFPPSIHDMFVGMGRVQREDFAEQYDIGIPLDESTRGNSDVLILYQTENAIPQQQRIQAQQSLVQFASAQQATENCHEMRVVLLRPPPKKKDTCIAIMGQWESYHVHKFMRVPSQQAPRKPGPNGKPPPMLSVENPLRYVSREMQDNGRGRETVSSTTTAKYFNEILIDYLVKLPKTLERLKPIAEQAALHVQLPPPPNPTTGGIRSTTTTAKALVVMVCNFGQSQLFVNFVCNARAKGLDLSHVLLFATDSKTVALAKALDVHVFDVQDAFGEMPERAARVYGDKNFAGMMLSKVYCVSLISQLGYDFLFQDVDMVWYQDPLTQFFYDPRKEVPQEFDIYFQDDGSRGARYAPYSPNTGLYFVRNNPETQYLFNVFLRMGDLIIHSHTHQAALCTVVAEHASWKGLRVKTLHRDSVLGRAVAGGFHYHRSKDYMKKFMKGEKSETENAVLFHMSWTKNKDNKRLFFQQMGEWYTQPQCEDKTVEQIHTSEMSDDVIGKCCTTEPIIQCHYRDKPSKIPCKDSPPIDQGRPSFW